MAVADTTGPLFQLPETTVDRMYAIVTPVVIDDVTTGAVTGTGAFDKIMASMKVHLQAEYEIGRITGAEYTKAYIELTQAALQTALQFVLGKEQAFWAAQTGQIQAITARVGLESAKYEYDNILPLKKAGMIIANDTADYNHLHIQPAQLVVLQQQAEVQHAQVSDTLLDGVTPLAGVMGAQEALYKQQITSYKRDAEVKAARIFTDAWITQKTIDDGLLPPPNFTNAIVDEVLGVIKTNNAL